MFGCVYAAVSRALAVVVHFGLDLVYFRSTLSRAGSQVSNADFPAFGLDFRKAYLVEEEHLAQDT